MTEAELKAIELRAKKATPGPWLSLVSDAGDAELMTVTEDILACGDLYTDNDPQNFDFLAHAREDIPALTAEVRRLWDSGNKQKREWCESIRRLDVENTRLRELLIAVERRIGSASRQSGWTDAMECAEWIRAALNPPAS